MKLRKDRKKSNRFWFGKKYYQWVEIEFPIRKIVKNIIFTIGGNFRVSSDPLTEICVERITCA